MVTRISPTPPTARSASTGVGAPIASSASVRSGSVTSVVAMTQEGPGACRVGRACAPLRRRTDPTETTRTMVPEIHYARSGDVSIAYQEVGDGPVDLVFVPFLSNLGQAWELPAWVAFWERMARFCRLIQFDKRGTGLSDRMRELPTLETRMDDVRAVMDAVGSEQAVVMGQMEGAQMTSLFAATYPERTSALVLYNPVARFTSTPDYPWGSTPDDWRRLVRDVADHWGEREFLEAHLRGIDPVAAEDPEYRSWYVTNYRLAASPAAAAALYRIMMDTDIRDVLPAIRVPTLVIHREDHRDASRYVAARIPGARVVELPGRGYLVPVGAEVAEETERFVRSLGEGLESDRVLTTILFTDIVGSTEMAAELGDRRWRELLEGHHARVRALLDSYRGREVDTAGDGFLATFDGPARAIRCAGAIVDSVHELGIQVRAGLHTGECELVEDKVRGIAVHVGARVAALAEPGEVLVSSTVKDLVAGSGLRFEDRGVHALRGVPGEWRVFAASVPA